MRDGLLLHLRAARIEVYHYDVPGHGRITWDIAAAKAEVAAGHLALSQPLPVPPEECVNIMGRCSWDEAHVAAVDPTIPGIAAPLLWAGQIMYVPIDGIHRVVRAVRDQVPFAMWLLADDASRRCILTGPRELIP